MSISNILTREYCNTKKVIRSETRKYPKYDRIIDLEDLMKSCITSVKQYIKCKEPEEWIRKMMLIFPIKCYGKYRRLYISKGQNPKIYDDQLAEVTSQLNEIPIELYY